MDTPGVRGFYFTASTGAHPQSSLALLPLARIRIQMFQLVSGPQRLLAPPRRTGGQLGPRARTHAAGHVADPGARFWAASGPAHPCRCHCAARRGHRAPTSMGRAPRPPRRVRAAPAPRFPRRRRPPHAQRILRIPPALTTAGTAARATLPACSRCRRSSMRPPARAATGVTKGRERSQASCRGSHGTANTTHP